MRVVQRTRRAARGRRRSRCRRTTRRSSASSTNARTRPTSTSAPPTRPRCRSTTTGSGRARRRRRRASGAPHSTTRRSGSPAASSTFTTSAPPSASNLAQYAPGQAARQVDDLHAGEGPGDAHPATVGQATPPPPVGGLPPFRARRIGGWLEACRSSGAGDRGVDVGPGRAAGALEGVVAARRAGRVTVGVAAAGWAGARRTERAIPDASPPRDSADGGAARQRPRVRPRATRRGGEAPGRDADVSVHGRRSPPRSSARAQPATAARRCSRVDARRRCRSLDRPTGRGAHARSARAPTRSSSTR